MKVILNAGADILAFWGEGKIQQSVYRLLTYTISQAVEGGTLLHNAVTGEMVLLDDAETQNLSSLPCAYAPWMDELIEKHFLVREESDDKKMVDTLRTAWRIGDNPREINGYTILPTTNCNARCFYCYQADGKRETMTDETADKLVDFIAAHRGNKRLYIGWFGGEPLVGMRQIDRISKALTERDIPFYSHMVSNASLFNEELVKRAKEEWKLEGIQITLDGTEKIYNETKAYVNLGENPYQKVLENIGILLDNDILVTVRLNLGTHNADDLNLLVEELAERFAGKKNLIVYSHLIYDKCGFEPICYTDKETVELREREKALGEKIKALALGGNGLRRDIPYLKKYSCMADNPDSVMVMPSGKFGKCEHYVEEHFVGCLADGDVDAEKRKWYQEWETYSFCSSCPIYPSCIRLTCCPAWENGCSPEKAQRIFDACKNTLKSVYEEFLRKDTNKAEPETDRRKGDTK